MASKKEEKKQKVKELQQPKYIENLLKTATKRKIENERRVERQVDKILNEIQSVNISPSWQ
jgi:hypothetical protein